MIMYLYFICKCLIFVDSVFRHTKCTLNVSISHCKISYSKSQNENKKQHHMSAYINTYRNYSIPFTKAVYMYTKRPTLFQES